MTHTDAHPSPELPTPGVRPWRRTLAPIVVEAALMALGVALALAADEWRQSRQHRQQAAAAAAAITEEMRLNRAAVDAAASYHGAMLDSLRARGSGDGDAPGPALFRRGFVAPATVSSAAWQTASETGVLEFLPHESVLRLSRTYGPQGRYERQAETVAGLIYGELYRGGAEGIARNHRNLGNLIGAFLYRERALVALYDSTLAAMEAAER